DITATVVFKTTALNRSAIPPRGLDPSGCLSNPHSRRSTAVERVYRLHPSMSNEGASCQQQIFARAHSSGAWFRTAALPALHETRKDDAHHEHEQRNGQDAPVQAGHFAGHEH